MKTSPLLLVAQGTYASSSAEAIWRAIERALGIPLQCGVIPEHEIVVYLPRDAQGAGASASRPQRIALPSDPAAPLAFAARRGGLPALAAMPAAAVQPASADDVEILIEFDRQSDAWTIARGAAGPQMLYFCAQRDRRSRFAAGTQLRALLPLFERRPEVDHVAVARYLCNGFFCEPETPVAGIRSVLPHQALRAAGADEPWRQVNDARFTRAAAPAPTPSATPADARRQVRERLIRTVEAHTAHSTETACLLSGGVDSSAVAAVAGRLLGKTVHSYTLVFEDAEISEAKYASAVARRIGTRHREVLLKQGDFEGSLDWMLSSLDMPTTDGLNSLLITKAIAQDGHPAALVGVGSDELFGGHECMQRVPRALSILGHVNRLPSPLRRLARAATAAATGRPTQPWLPSRGLRGKFLALLDGQAEPLDVYLLSRRVLLPDAVAQLSPRADEAAYRSLPAALLERRPQDLARQLLSKQISYYEQLLYLRNQLLRDLQMVGVATGVDIGVPFVDPDLVAQVSSLPAADVFGGGRPKQFLIDCVADVLPQEAYLRPKLGFVLPIGQWLGGLVSSRFQSLSSQADLLATLDLNLDAMNRIMADCASARGRVFYTREWSLFVLLDWCARNLLGLRPGS